MLPKGLMVAPSPRTVKLLMSTNWNVELTRYTPAGSSRVWPGPAALRAATAAVRAAVSFVVPLPSAPKSSTLIGGTDGVTGGGGGGGVVPGSGSGSGVGTPAAARASSHATY